MCREVVPNLATGYWCGQYVPDLFSAVFPLSSALCTLLLTVFAERIKEPPHHQAEMVPQLSVWGYGIPGYVNKYCFRTAGLTIFLPEFQSARHGCECISDFSLGAR